MTDALIMSMSLGSRARIERTEGTVAGELTAAQRWEILKVTLADVLEVFRQPRSPFPLAGLIWDRIKAHASIS